MRARAAYISSLGTGGILVASALLMLALVSALVAFHAWPGGHAASGTVSIPLNPSSSDAAPARAVTATPRASRVAGASVRVRDDAGSRSAAAGTAGLHKAPAQPSQVVSGGQVFGMVKVPPTTDPIVPPVQFPPPSTGPQTQTQPTAPTSPDQRQRYDPGPKGIQFETLPNVLPPSVDDTAGNVVGAVPPPPQGVQATVEQITLPGDQLDGALSGTGVTLPGR
jgi:hypothetical protein